MRAFIWPAFAIAATAYGAAISSPLSGDLLTSRASNNIVHHLNSLGSKLGMGTLMLVSGNMECDATSMEETMPLGESRGFLLFPSSDLVLTIKTYPVPYHLSVPASSSKMSPSVAVPRITPATRRTPRPHRLLSAPRQRSSTPPASQLYFRTCWASYPECCSSSNC